MPELPEVETMRRGIEPVIGRRIAGVERPICRKKPISLTPLLAAWRARAVGRSIVASSRAGKRVVLELDSADRIVFEPRMTGLVLIADPPTLEHLRLSIQLAGRPKLELMYWDRRGLGSARLLTADQFAERFSSANLGPDALFIMPDQLRAGLSHSQRAIKVALLDQRAVAGIGNLYASEILHRCRIHPGQRCNTLADDLWWKLHAAIGEILTAAIRHEGSTLSDGTYRNALNQDGDYQNHHRVYDKAGQRCAVCHKGQILRVVMAQRSTFFCPICQPRRKSRVMNRRGKIFASARSGRSNAGG